MQEKLKMPEPLLQDPLPLLRRAKPDFHFAELDQGRELLTERDDFVKALSPFDRAARLKTQRTVSGSSFLAWVARNIRPWNPNKRQLVEAALIEVEAALSKLPLPWPARIELIMSTGQEEGGAAYTRGQAIVLPEPVLAQHQPASLSRLILHELFHTLTRSNPELKRRLYASIGFYYCGELSLPPALRLQKITNPDAPLNDYCIRLSAQQPFWAMPLLLSDSLHYQPERGGEFFDYLRLKFLDLAPADSDTPPQISPLRDFKLYDPAEISGFFEQVGRNTDYILHPEEILADNFALLMLAEQGLTSPEIPEKMLRIFRE